MPPQFNYTKMIIVVDDDINAQRWEDIAWATATRMDSSRDLMLVENSPIDYLDFPSPSRALAASPASTPP